MRSHPRAPRTPIRRFGAAVAALGAAAALAACSSGGASADSSGDAVTLRSVSLIAPADPGGGWDQTARSISQKLTSGRIIGSAPVTNISGAGGTVGLASLANEKDAATLMVTGLVMVGAVETNASDARIEDTTPIAKLTEEPLVVVVPKGSPYETIDDLIDAIVTTGKEVAVTGGSAGGADHILAGMLLTEAGVKPADVTGKLNYIANSGGGEAVTMLLGKTVQAGISGVGEFSEQIQAGALRALAVSSPERAEQLPDVPTLTEEGHDVELTNWRGLLAPGGISASEKAALEKLVTELHSSKGWKDELAAKGWTDAFMVGDEFSTFLDGNIAEVKKTLTTIGLVTG